MPRVLAPARGAIAPDWDRSLTIIGDIHVGKNGDERNISPRMEAMRQGFNHYGPWWQQAAALCQVGDLIEGETGVADQLPVTCDAQLAIAKPWWDSWDHPVKRVCYGNHDDNTPYSQAIMGANWGQPENAYHDLDFIRIINVSYVAFGGATQAFVEASCASTSLPCVLLIHLPPAGQISADARNLDITGLQMTAGQNTNFNTVVANNANLKGVFTGHCHCYWDTTGMVGSRTSGANKVALGNASALTYVGTGPDWLSDPMMALVATLSEDETSMEFRWRNLSAEVWMLYAGAHVTTITGL